MNVASTRPSPKTLKVRVDTIGGPRRVWLEIKGMVFIYHRSWWAVSASEYFPVEWLTVSRHLRFDGRYLALGLLVAMLTVFLVVAPAALVHSWRPEVMPHLTPLFLLIAFVGLVLCMVWCSAFFRRRPTVRITIHTQPRPGRIEFWYRPRSQPAIDSLIRRLETLPKQVEDMTLYPVHMSQTRYRLRPFRAVLTKVIFYTFVAYWVIRVATLFTGQRAVLAWLLLLPAAYYLGRYAIEGLLHLREPRVFREALKAYYRGRLAEAEDLLRPLVNEQPEFGGARILLLRTFLEQQKFDEAFRECGQLRAFNSEAADAIAHDIWAIKRLYDRMDIVPDSPAPPRG